MRQLNESDIFRTNQRQANDLNTKIRLVLNNSAEDTVILNRKLNSQLATLRATFKESIVRKVCDAVDNGEIILYCTSPTYMLPTCMPFYKYNKSGKIKVNVDLTNFIRVDTNAETGEKMYSIEVKKFYVLLVSAYLYLRIFEKKTVLPPAVAETSATIWAKMFCKVLANEVGLATNVERYDAFMYFAVKFFCRYYLESPEAVANNIAMSVLKKRARRDINPIAGNDIRTPLIHYIENQIEERNINIYESLNTFLTTMFNFEITGIRHSRISEKGKSLTVTYFINKFVKTYDFAALYALGAYPYFIYVILGVFNNAFMFNDRILEDIISTNSREVPGLLNALYTMAQ